VGGEDLCGEGSDRFPVGDVEPVTADLDRMRLGERSGFRQAVLVEVGEGEVAAALRQSQSRAAADAARRRR
jgi:hypothetical protein